MKDERVDWSTEPRLGLMSGGCGMCLHVAPLHERGCINLEHREQPCACARCDELPDGLPVPGRDRPAPRIPDLSPDEIYLLSTEQEAALRAAGDRLAEGARAVLAEVEPMRIGPAQIATAPEDLVEELRGVFVAAWQKRMVENADQHDAELDGIRAVLTELAGMGADALPSVESIEARIVTESGKICYVQQTPAIETTLEMARANIAPILAAKDAELERMRAENEQLRAKVSQAVEPSSTNAQTDTPHDCGACYYCGII